MELKSAIQKAISLGIQFIRKVGWNNALLHMVNKMYYKYNKEVCKRSFTTYVVVYLFI